MYECIFYWVQFRTFLPKNSFEYNFPVRKTGEGKLQKRYEAQNLDSFLFAVELIFKYFGLIS